MPLQPKDCCILNSGSGAWAFEPLARQLSQTLEVEVSDQPRRFNYLLHVADAGEALPGDLFIPMAAIRLASDKRLLAAVFKEHKVPTPMTRLIDSFDAVLDFACARSGNQWCLKYPTSCGANGHRILTPVSEEPPNWPRPFIVQEFIAMERPEVYRTYCAGGEVFGWVVRRYPEGVKSSPWVAHAQGARYACLGEPPESARTPARSALAAAKLLDSFGCVDMLCKPDGEWVVLEVGTDGLYNHVDRDLGDAEMERRLQQRVAEAFWGAAGKLE